MTTQITGTGPRIPLVLVAAPKRRGKPQKRNLGLLPGSPPIRVWQDRTTGELCFRPKGQRKVRTQRMSLAQIWDYLNGQGALL